MRHCMFFYLLRISVILGIFSTYILGFLTRNFQNTFFLYSTLSLRYMQLNHSHSDQNLLRDNTANLIVINMVGRILRYNNEH
jgi:hypothetical protein